MVADEKIEFIATARDEASATFDGIRGSIQKLDQAGSQSLSGVTGKMKALTAEARNLHRTTAGVSKFANAIDTVAGTNLGNIIGDISTVAEIAGPLKSLGGALASTLTDAVSGAWQSVATSSAVQTAIGKARSGWAAAAGKIDELSAPLTTAVSDAWAAVAGSSVVQAAAKKAGMVFGEGAAESAGASFASHLPDVLTPLLAGGGLIAGGAGLLAGIGAIGTNILDALTPSITPAQLLKAKNTGTTLGTAAGEAVGPAFVNAAQKTVDLGATGTQFNWTATLAQHIASEHEDLFNTQIQHNYDQSALRLTDHIGGTLKSGMMVATTQAAAAAAKAGANELSNSDIWKNSAMDIGSDIVSALYSDQNSVKKAMQSLTKAETDPLKLARKEQHIQAAMSSKQLATDLTSKNLFIRTKAEQTQQYLIGLWEQLTGTPYPAQAAQNLATDLSSTYPEIKGKASAFVKQYNDILSGLKTSYHINIDVARGIAGKVAHLPTFASGGYPSAGTPSVVGEQGPEIVTFGRGARVWRSGTGPASSGGSGDVYIDGEKVGRVLYDHLDHRQGQRLALAGGGSYQRG